MRVPNHTPSEDGGEVGQLLVTALRQYQHNDCSGLLAGYDCAEAKRIVSDLIAQHSRIVAAKDAEISRLRELHENAHSAAKTLMAEKATLMEQAAHWLEVNAPSGGCIETNIADELRAEAEQLRAQPAVAVVMPTVDQVMKVVMRYQWEDRANVTGTTNWAANLGMAVVNEVARLNRLPCSARGE